MDQCAHRLACRQSSVCNQVRRPVHYQWLIGPHTKIQTLPTTLLQTQLNWHPLPHWGLNLHQRYLATEYGDKGDMNQNDFYYYKASEPSVGIGVHYTW